MKHILRKPALLPFMAAAAIGGLAIYAVGETLNLLFEDVAEPKEEKTAAAEETELTLETD